MKSELYPEALIIEPMLVSHIPTGKENRLPEICNNGEYFGEIKRDGACYSYSKANTGIGYLFGRTVSKETGVLTEKGKNVPHIMTALDCLPNNTVLVGEICYYDLTKTSKDITAIMGCLPDKAIERQKNEYGYVYYYLHDVLYYNGTNLMDYGASIRYNLLVDIYNKFELNKRCSYITLAERIDENLQESINEALKQGHEGMVLKKKTATYDPGKRTAWAQIKIKKTDNADVICLGWEEPTREYTGKTDLKDWPYWENGEPITKPYALGWRTSMRIGAYNTKGEIEEIGNVSSGLTDSIREAAGKDSSFMVGSCVSVSGMEKDNKAHTLRHFFFKAFRDDKDAKQCLISDIFG